MATGPGRLLAAVAAAAVTTVLAACGAAAVGAGAPVGAPTASAGAAPSSAGPSAPPSEAASAQRALPLYYVTDTPAGPRLAREFHRLPVGADAAAAGSAALTELFAGPAGAVPGHRNLWPTGTALASPVTHTDGAVTVDLVARTVDTAPADPLLAVQQLVYTVT